MVAFFCPPPLWARNSSVIPLAFVTSATSRTGAITIPAGSSVGNWAILFDFAWNSSPVPTQVTPSGWTSATTGIQDAGSNDSRVNVSYKKLDSGEPGSSVTGMSGSSMVKIMLVFTGPAIATPSLWTSQNIPSAVSQSVPASSISAPAIIFGCASAMYSGSVTFSTASPAFDSSVGNTGTSPGMLVGYKIYSSGMASNHSIGMGDLCDANSLAVGVISF